MFLKLIEYRVLIWYGYPEIGAHVRSNLFYLICLRQLNRSMADKSIFFFSEKTYFPSGVHNMFWYKYHLPKALWSGRGTISVGWETEGRHQNQQTTNHWIISFAVVVNHNRISLSGIFVFWKIWKSVFKYKVLWLSLGKPCIDSMFNLSFYGVLKTPSLDGGGGGGWGLNLWKQ